LRQNPSAENIAPLHIDLQGDYFILRGPFPFSMKPYVNAVFLFFTSFKSTTLFHGLLRWCSNQSPGREQFLPLRGKTPICLVLPFPVKNEPA